MSLKKSNHQGYMVDSKTGLVINTNESELRSYRVQVDAVKRVQASERKMDSIIEEFELLKKIVLEK